MGWRRATMTVASAAVQTLMASPSVFDAWKQRSRRDWLPPTMRKFGM